MTLQAEKLLYGDYEKMGMISKMYHVQTISMTI